MKNRHVDYIAQFNSKILYIKDKANIVADTISRIDTISNNDIMPQIK